MDHTINLRPKTDTQIRFPQTNAIITTGWRQLNALNTRSFHLHAKFLKPPSPQSQQPHHQCSTFLGPGWICTPNCILIGSACPRDQYTQCRTTPRESYCRRRGYLTPTRCCRSCNGYQWSSASRTNWPSWPTRHVRHLCQNISVDTSRHEVARGHCDRRPRHCCMSHSDELPSANALSALQHHLSGTLSLSPYRIMTRLHYLNLDLKHICSPPSMLLNCPVRQRLWSHGNMAF